MQDRQAGYLLDMLRSSEAIQDYVRGYDREAFLRDSKTQDAVLRRLLVIGEAAARLTPETTAAFGRIPFSKIVGMRNRVVHDYGQVDFDIIWETVVLHLPALREDLAVFFAEDEPSAG